MLVSWAPARSLSGLESFGILRSCPSFHLHRLCYCSFPFHVMAMTPLHLVGITKSFLEHLFPSLNQFSLFRWSSEEDGILTQAFDHIWSWIFLVLWSLLSTWCFFSRNSAIWSDAVSIFCRCHHNSRSTNEAEAYFRSKSSLRFLLPICLTGVSWTWQGVTVSWP